MDHGKFLRTFSLWKLFRSSIAGFFLIREVKCVHCPGAIPMKHLNNIQYGCFYESPKINPIKHFFAKLLVKTALKLKV